MYDLSKVQQYARQVMAPFGYCNYNVTVSFSLVVPVTSQLGQSFENALGHSANHCPPLTLAVSAGMQQFWSHMATPSSVVGLQNGWFTISPTPCKPSTQPPYMHM